MTGFRNTRTLADAQDAGQYLYASFRKQATQTTGAGIWFDLSMSPGNPAPNYYIGAVGAFTPLRQSTDGGIRHGGNVAPSRKFLRKVMAFTTTGTARATGALEADSNPTVDLSPATLAAAVWAEVLESGLDAGDVMRLLLAVAAGKTDISGTTVTFRDQADTKNRVTAEMTGSERTTVVVNAG